MENQFSFDIQYKEKRKSRKFYVNAYAGVPLRMDDNAHCEFLMSIVGRVQARLD